MMHVLASLLYGVVDVCVCVWGVVHVCCVWHGGLVWVDTSQLLPSSLNY